MPLSIVVIDNNLAAPFGISNGTQSNNISLSAKADAPVEEDDSMSVERSGSTSIVKYLLFIIIYFFTFSSDRPPK